MPRNQVVRYNPRNISRRSYNRALRAIVQSNRARALAKRAARKAIKYGMNRLTTYAKRRASNAIRQVVKRPRKKNYVRVVGQASGTTHTTTRMIVRRTPREQRFLRKLFKNRPVKNMYVQRFGFAWMGANQASKTIWYSVSHWKFNNIHDAMKNRIMAYNQNVGTSLGSAAGTQVVGNGPDSFIYIGKCTYNYELYNPTNYIVTVYIYDLICKHDTPYSITYGQIASNSSAPECVMSKGIYTQYSENNPTNPSWTVADNTLEDGSFWNTVGMKPTDYHIFNTMWKVKGMKKIILPPTSSHHHVVVYNPKVKVTQASLYYTRQTLTGLSKNGVAGITQSTLFGFEGQVAVEDAQTTDSTNQVGTLPGKLIVKCIKKENVWNGDLATTNIVSKIDMKTSWTKPTIFTDLVEAQAADTGHTVPIPP